MSSVVDKLQAILDGAEQIFIAHGRRMYSLNDPKCPQEKVVAFLKTQLEKALASSKGEAPAV